jgi:hypothetical protein
MPKAVEAFEWYTSEPTLPLRTREEILRTRQVAIGGGRWHRPLWDRSLSRRLFADLHFNEMRVTFQRKASGNPA